jgi:hypothetical protein
MWPSALKEEWKKCSNVKEIHRVRHFIRIGNEMANAVVSTIDSGMVTSNRLKLTYPFHSRRIEVCTKLVEEETEKLFKILRGEETYVEENLVIFFRFHLVKLILDIWSRHVLFFFSELFSAREMEKFCAAIPCPNAFSDGQNFCHVGMYSKMHDEIYHSLCRFSRFSRHA